MLTVYPLRATLQLHSTTVPSSAPGFRRACFSDRPLTVPIPSRLVSGSLSLPLPRLPTMLGMTTLSSAPDAHADRTRLLARELWRAQRTRQLPTQYARHQYEAFVTRLGATKTTAQMHIVLDQLAQGSDLQTIAASL